MGVAFWGTLLLCTCNTGVGLAGLPQQYIIAIWCFHLGLNNWLASVAFTMSWLVSLWVGAVLFLQNNKLDDQCVWKGYLNSVWTLNVEYVNKTMPMNYFLFPHCFDTSHTRAGKKSSKSDTSKHWHVFIGMKLSSISRSVLSVVYLARALSLGAVIDYLFREIKHRQMYEEVRRTKSICNTIVL